MTATAIVLRARQTGDLAALEEAERLARDARDWCAIAETLAMAGRDRAHHGLERALRAAEADALVARNVARIQRTWLDDPAAAARTLAGWEEALLARPEAARSWWLLADAWRALGDPDAALHHLAHATAFARDVAEHCEIAERRADLGASPELGAAIALARSARDHVRLAKTYDLQTRRWPNSSTRSIGARPRPTRCW